MKKKFFSILAVMLMTLTANAEKTITWDYNTIKGINFSYQDYEISDNYSILSKDGITMFALTGNWSITGLTHRTWFQDCTLGSNTTLFEHDEIYFRSAIGRITSITITCSDGERTIYDANYYGWTTSQFSVSWTGEPSNDVIMPLKQHSEIEGITKIIFTVDDVCKYKVYWSEDYNVTPGTEVEKGTTLVFTPIDPSRGKINSLKICDNRGLEYYINLTDNGDGTWSLPAMPDYDVYLYDIIDKYYAIDNTPKSWSINGNLPDDFYSAEEGKEIVVKPYCLNGKVIKSIKVVDYALENVTYFTNNGDGTWTLAAMPGYNVIMVVEYVGDGPKHTISNIPDGWKVNGLTTSGTYEAEEGAMLIFTPANIPAGKKIQSIKAVSLTSDKTIILTDNGNGTWTLASMPAYNVALEVEYEDDDSNSEVYTEFAEETGTLTYYYDGQREERSGKTELYDPVGDPDAVRFTGYYRKVTKAVIDPSMKKAPLTSFNGMFYGGTNQETWVMQTLSKMKSIEGLENLNTEEVTDMSNMFTSCSSLTSLDLSTFNTGSVTKMVAMFQLCENLEMVDVSSFDISKVTDMGQMFNYCPKLKTICCFTDWSGTSATSDFMFSNCTSLVGGMGTVFDNNFRDKTYARPDGGTASPGYFTAETMTSIASPLGETGEGAIYNLAGQMINGKLPRGIYIVGGKKIVLK